MNECQGILVVTMQKKVGPKSWTADLGKQLAIGESPVKINRISQSLIVAEFYQS